MYHIIINPAAGRGRTLKHLPFLEKLLDENGVDYEKHETTGISDGYEKAKSIKASQGIIGIGGDGTFQEIAAGMVDAFETYKSGQKIPIPLGVFPAGSGNDFIMTLVGGKKAALSKYGKNPEQNAKEFFETLMRNKTRTVDIITANGKAFLNTGNIGLDARIVRNAADLKERYGRKAYLAAVYKSIAQHKNLTLTVEADGERIEGQFTLAAACNGQYYGGGMRISPSSKLDDGKITLCLVDGVSRTKIMVLFPSLMIEMHTRLKFLKYIECSRIRFILPTGAETLCLDGNLYPVGDEIEFKILPKALDVFI